MYQLVSRKSICYKFLSLACYLFPLVIANKCIAQIPNFCWSEKFNTKGDFRFVGFKDSSLYAVQNRENKDVVLRSFTPALRLNNETIWSVASGGPPANYLLSFISDTGLVHIMYQYDRKKDSLIISTSSNSISSMKAGSTRFVQAFYSADRSKLLICNSYYHRKTRNTDRDFIVLSTATSKLIYSGTFSYNYLLETPDGIHVDNLGNAYFGTITYQRTGSKLSGKSNAIHHVKIISPGGSTAAFTVSFPGKYVPGIDIVEEENNAVYIAGLSYDGDIKASRTSSADLFLYRIDPERLLYRDSVHTTVNGLYQEGKLKEDDRLPYTIRHIYEKTSGELVIIAEQYQQIFNQYSTREKYHDISCIQLNKDQSFGSIVRIPKLQYDFNNPSIVSTFINDKAYLLYNDPQENLAATGESVQYAANNKDKNGLFLVTIGQDSQVKKELLYGYDSGKPMPVILSSYIINNRTIFICSDERVGLLKFEN
jgi:hypothetical protein